MIKTREYQRLLFVYKTQGFDGLMSFVQQGFKQYKTALDSVYGKCYKGEILGSLEVYERILYMQLGGHTKMIVEELKSYETETA